MERVGADEAERRRFDERSQASAVAAVERYRASDPQGWADYLSDAEESAAADAPIADR